MRHAWLVAVTYLCCALAPDFSVAGLSGVNTFEFDGTTNFFEIPAPGPDYAPIDFTFEAWVNPSSVTGRHAIFATNDPSVDGYGIYIEDGELVVEIRGEINSSTNAGFVVDEWQHVAVARTGNFIRLYRNNSLAGIRQTLAAPPVSNTAAYVGGDAGGDLFAGRIDELRIWSIYRDGVALEVTRYRTVSVFEPFVAVYFRFDEGSGTTITDLITSNGTEVGTLTGTPTWLASTAPITDLSNHATNTFVIWDSQPSSSVQIDQSGLRTDNVDFFAQEGDDLAMGHDDATFSLVSGDVPAAVGARWARVFELAASDVNADGGTVQLTFDESEAGGPGALDASRPYYLLRRAAGSSDDFEALSAEMPAGSDQVVFDVDVDDIGIGQEFTLGTMAETSIGLYFDGAYTQTELVDQPLFTPFDAWVVIKDVNGDMAGDGLAQWEAMVDLPPEIEVVDATLVPPGAVNSGDPGDVEWIVDTLSCLEPDGSGDIAVLQYSLQLIDRPGAVASIGFSASDPSSFAPPAPGWIDCEGNSAFFTTLVASTLRFPSPNVESVTDVPDDQGGWVRVSVDRSTLDDVGASPPVSGYNLWREVTAPKTASGVALTLESAAGIPGASQLLQWDARVVDGHVMVMNDAVNKGPNSVPPGTWEIVASFFAAQQEKYTVLAATVVDGVPTSFFVSAHTTTPSTWYGSEPGSGSSLDNIAPGVPSNVTADYAAAGVDLAWDAAPEEDFQFYRVYRGTSPDFDLGTGDVVQETASPAWTDATASPWGFYYKITALDHAGNESAAGSPGTVTATDPAPRRYALGEPSPNPFNPRTTISFTLQETGPVRLDVYDLAGRRVKTLLREVMPAGVHEAQWNGTDDGGHAVASGVYTFRIQAAGFVATQRATLLK